MITMFKLYYCRTCKKVIDRRFVVPRNYEDGYRCKWCGGRVLNAWKLLAWVFEDILDYAEKKGVDVDEFE